MKRFFIGLAYFLFLCYMWVGLILLIGLIGGIIANISCGFAVNYIKWYHWIYPISTFIVICWMIGYVISYYLSKKGIKNCNGSY